MEQKQKGGRGVTEHKRGNKTKQNKTKHNNKNKKQSNQKSVHQYDNIEKKNGKMKTELVKYGSHKTKKRM